MTHSEFRCFRCGSANLKRSHHTTILDGVKMLVGRYPFRCMDCRERTWVDLRLFRRGQQLRCPRCLRHDVYAIPNERLHASWWNNLRLAMGGRGYRCAFCSYKFISLKKRNTPASSQSRMASAAGQ